MNPIDVAQTIFAQQGRELLYQASCNSEQHEKIKQALQTFRKEMQSFSDELYRIDPSILEQYVYYYQDRLNMETMTQPAPLRGALFLKNAGQFERLHRSNLLQKFIKEINISSSIEDNQAIFSFFTHKRNLEKNSKKTRLSLDHLLSKIENKSLLSLEDKQKKGNPLPPVSSNDEKKNLPSDNKEVQPQAISTAMTQQEVVTIIETTKTEEKEVVKGDETQVKTEVVVEETPIETKKEVEAKPEEKEVVKDDKTQVKTEVVLEETSIQTKNETEKVEETKKTFRLGHIHIAFSGIVAAITSIATRILFPKLKLAGALVCGGFMSVIYCLTVSYFKERRNLQRHV